MNARSPPTTRVQVLAAQICSAVCGYAHFNIEHNKGHHKDVSTPEDPRLHAWANRFKFALRNCLVPHVAAGHPGSRRLRRQKRSAFHHTMVAANTAITVVAYRR